MFVGESRQIKDNKCRLQEVSQRHNQAHARTHAPFRITLVTEVLNLSFFLSVLIELQEEIWLK